MFVFFVGGGGGWVVDSGIRPDYQHALPSMIPGSVPDFGRYIGSLEGISRVYAAAVQAK